MSNLQKYQPTESVQIQTKFGLLYYVAPKDLTKEQKAILAAYTAPKIATVSDIELDAFILRQINQALVLLGHSNTLKNTDEQASMSDAFTELIKGKFSFLTLEDIALVFKMGIQGEFKLKPEEVVMISITQISQWLKYYHKKTRAEVIAQLKPAEAPKGKPEGYNPETDFNALLQKVKAGDPVTDTEWVCQTGQHYERLNNSNAFNLSTQQRQVIYQEEREKRKEAGQADNLQRKKDTRFAFLAFMEGQAGDNQFEKEVKTNCKIRVFREYVQALAKSKAA